MRLKLTFKDDNYQIITTLKELLFYVFGGYVKKVGLVWKGD